MKTDLSRSRARKARRVEKAAESQALAALGGIPLLYDVRLPDGTELKATRIPRNAWAIRKPKRPRKAKRKKSPTLSKLKKLLWNEISLLVRSWSPVCLGCGQYPTVLAAHIIPSGNGAATRFFLPNLYPACRHCNEGERRQRVEWFHKHKELFGDDYVECLYLMSQETFQLKKDWVLDQTERIKKLRQGP